MLKSTESFEIDDNESVSKQEKALLKNRRNLEECKKTGYEMEDVAGDIKFNLKK